MVLTTAGQVLHRHAEALVHRLADARAEIDALVAGDAGRVVLGSFPTATASFAAASVASFQQRHPQVEVRLVDGSRTRASHASSCGSSTWRSSSTW